MLVTDKKADIAILQTLGMAPKRIMKIFMLNGSYNGLLGALLGTVTGILLTLFLNDIMSIIGINLVAGTGMQGLPVLIQWHQVFIIAVGSCLLCFLATLYPAYHATRIAPADALREE